MCRNLICSLDCLYAMLEASDMVMETIHEKMKQNDEKFHLVYLALVAQTCLEV